MSQELRVWLGEQEEALCRATLYRVPNLLPDEQDVTEFLQLMAENLGAAREEQLSTVQFWALTSIGHDAPFASDWVTVLRVLKEEIIKALQLAFPAEAALKALQQLDDFLTYALIEATQITSDMDRTEILQHMVDLRRQQERVERTKGNFIAVAAHELRTPLTILEGYANMLRVETDPNSHLRIYVDGLENGTRRMHEIITDIIDVSLIDLQTFELKFQQFYLEKVILMAADKLDKHFAERHVDLVIMPLPVEQRIYGDPERLFKAFTKVMTNALKYTPDGGRVTVNSVLTRMAESSDDIAGYIDVQIADTGIGIDPENFDIIFHRFTSLMDASLHSSGKYKFKGGGPGLGLPIAKGIIEAHGGQIWVESPGYDEEAYPGTTFHLEIPLLVRKPGGGADEDEAAS
ncbi:MAG: HAMP domain-containing histidine kinase [Anaerolineales bacterium]|nr:HAMP domain-containing histidine kinase [Anaerolineales bacterium]